jgi:hypothetical protein
VYVYYEFAFQRTRLRVDLRGVLDLGLIIVYVYYDFAFQSARFGVG